jgi:hypothetical protein
MVWHEWAISPWTRRKRMSWKASAHTRLGASPCDATVTPVIGPEGIGVDRGSRSTYIPDRGLQ